MTLGRTSPQLPAWTPELMLLTSVVTSTDWPAAVRMNLPESLTMVAVGKFPPATAATALRAP